MQAYQFFPFGTLDSLILNKSEESSLKSNKDCEGIPSVSCFYEVLSGCLCTVLAVLHTLS